MTSGETSFVGWWRHGDIVHMLVYVPYLADLAVHPQTKLPGPVTTRALLRQSAGREGPCLKERDVNCDRKAEQSYY